MPLSQRRSRPGVTIEEVSLSRSASRKVRHAFCWLPLIRHSGTDQHEAFVAAVQNGPRLPPQPVHASHSESSWLRFTPHAARHLRVTSETSRRCLEWTPGPQHAEHGRPASLPVSDSASRRGVQSGTHHGRWCCSLTLSVSGDGTLREQSRLTTSGSGHALCAGLRPLWRGCSL